MQIVEEIIYNFENNKSLYIGENITIADHMIQSAMLAEKSKCDDDLICSCLLHDYGHFVIDDPDKLVENNKDGEHEIIGYKFLKKYFSNKVVNPIKYHVLAKRYLARDEKYYNKLSKASKISLKLQGGVLNDKECEDFENKDYFKSSILLRKFDEASKKVGIKMKNINQYKELLKLKLK